MGNALNGVRVIDFTEGMMGSLASVFLGDFGAEIIKLETHEGDPYRNLDSAARLPKANWNYYFEYCNRNKKSIDVNPDTDKGKEIVYELVKQANVFVTNLTGQKLHGLDYETLSKLNPGLVYAVGSACGPNGPDTDMPPIEELVYSRVGMTCTIGEPGYPPVMTRLGEPVTAVHLAYGIMLALFHQKRTGEGQRVDASLLGSDINLSGLILQTYLGLGAEERKKVSKGLLMPTGRLGQGNPLLITYKFKNKWIYLLLLQPMRYWPNFCKLMGIEHLENDPRFNTIENMCFKHNNELVAIIDEIAAKKTITKEWMKQWDEAGMIYQVLQDFEEISVDSQALENRFIIDVDHPTEGKIKMIGFPVQMVKTPARLARLAPALGEHTVEVLVDSLGYTLDEITQLKKEKVIG